MKFLKLFALLTVSSITLLGQENAKIIQVYKGGDKANTGYHTFRIPTLAVTKKGTLLAFAEGRVNGSGDAGNIDVVLRRSTNNGKTWKKTQIVFDDRNNTCRNPVPVIDQKTGTIMLVTTWSDKSEHDILAGKGKCKIFVQYSKDDGKNWTKPKDVTPQTNKNDWRWYATGPCNGIQIQEGKYKGRVVIASNHSVSENNRNMYRAHSIYSDDFGKTWKIGEIAGDGSNESTIAECADGTLVQNMRQQTHSKNLRTQRFSSDGGATWTKMEEAKDLYCPTCQGSIVRDYNSKRLYFSNPRGKGRNNMAVYYSDDNAKSWNLIDVIWNAPAAYSNVAVLKNKQIGVLYECGRKQITESISFSTLSPKKK